MANINEGEGSIRKDLEPQIHTFGVFANDERGFAREYASCFDGLNLFTPIIIDTPSARKARVELEKVQLDCVSIVIAEQYFDNPYMRSAMANFIGHLRQVNKTAWIVETGGAAVDHFYEGTNGLIPTSHMFDISKKLQEEPFTLQARLRVLKNFTSESFEEAQSAEFLTVTDSKDVLELFRILDKASKHTKFPDVLALLSITEEDFTDKIPNLPQEFIPEAMHTLWMVIGHLEIGNGVEFYSGSLTRLMNLLEGKKTR